MAPEFWRAQLREALRIGCTQTDASSRIGIGAYDGKWNVALVMKNLTDEDTLQTNDDARQVTQYQTFGANYLLTAIYKFW